MDTLSQMIKIDSLMLKPMERETKWMGIKLLLEDIVGLRNNLNMLGIIRKEL